VVPVEPGLHAIFLSPKCVSAGCETPSTTENEMATLSTNNMMTDCFINEWYKNIIDLLEHNYYTNHCKAFVMYLKIDSIIMKLSEMFN
jgi:hypothetical protein